VRQDRVVPGQVLPPVDPDLLLIRVADQGRQVGDGQTGEQVEGDVLLAIQLPHERAVEQRHEHDAISLAARLDGRGDRAGVVGAALPVEADVGDGEDDPGVGVDRPRPLQRRLGTGGGLQVLRFGDDDDAQIM